MITTQKIRNRAAEYARSHPREVRFLCFFAVFALVWTQADNIESFTHGFFDGVYDAGQK